MAFLAKTLLTVHRHESTGNRSECACACVAGRVSLCASALSRSISRLTSAHDIYPICVEQRRQSTIYRSTIRIFCNKRIVHEMRGVNESHSWAPSIHCFFRLPFQMISPHGRSHADVQLGNRICQQHFYSARILRGTRAMRGNGSTI